MSAAPRPSRAKPQGWILRVGRAHKRLALSALLGVVVLLLLPVELSAVTRLLIGWDIGVLAYLVAAASMMTGSTSLAIRHNAAAQDEGALALLLLSVCAAVASLGAIFAEAAAVERTNPHYALYIALTIVTVLLSWTFTHTIFALHYAHDFYGERSRQDGLTFPGGGEPDYWDFVYFAFVVGMTFQVSDVAITAKSIRRMVVAHGVLSFFFTTAIVALTVNIAANLIQK